VTNFDIVLMQSPLSNFDIVLMQSPLSNFDIILMQSPLSCCLNVFLYFNNNIQQNNNNEIWGCEEITGSKIKQDVKPCRVSWFFSSC
jgi:hypothetical protein